MNLNLQFNETNQQVSPEFKDVSYFSSGEGGTPDHSKLINREAADQHPHERYYRAGRCSGWQAGSW